MQDFFLFEVENNNAVGVFNCGIQRITILTDCHIMDIGNFSEQITTGLFTTYWSG